MDPLIIEAAINGGTPKSKHAHVPRSVEEIVADACACLDAGAAIVHNHNDDPVIGGPGRHASAPYAEAWRRIRVRHPDAILYPTMAGGGPHTNIQERYAHIEELAALGLLRTGNIDPGTLNQGGLDGQGAPAASERVYQTTLADVRYMVDCCRSQRLGPNFSIWEPSFLRAAVAYHRAGKLPPGALVKLYFGGPSRLFGLLPTRAGLEAYLEMLEGTGLPWMVAVLGGDVTRGLAQMAIERGGHVRIGLEDYEGERSPRNADLVREIVALARNAGRDIATPAEAADLLGLPARQPA